MTAVPLGCSEVITQPGGAQQVAIRVPSIAHAAATATELICAFTASFACRLKAVYFTPYVAITGADTNTTHLNVHNRGAEGSGTTEIGNKDFTNGVNALIAKPVEIVSGLTTALADGDTVAIQAEKIGTGLDIPAGVFHFVIDGGA